MNYFVVIYNQYGTAEKIIQIFYEKINLHCKKINYQILP